MKATFRPQFWRVYEDGMRHYLKVASHVLADRWADAVDVGIADVRQQPDLGRLRRDLQPAGLRSRVLHKPFNRYVFFYLWRRDDQSVEFLRVKHGPMHVRTFQGEPTITSLELR